jgi:hypothetical protein
MATPAPKKPRSRKSLLGIGCLGLILICVCMAIVGSFAPKTTATETPTPAPAKVVTVAPGQPTNTPRPTSAPAPTNTPRPTATVAKPSLELIEVHAENDTYSRYVAGTIKNNTTRTYRYVQVMPRLYDASGAQVGSAMDNVASLEPGGIWKFRALILDDRTTQFKVSETDISGY